MSSTRIVGTIRREEKCELGESWEMWCWCLANRARYMTETWEGLRVAGCEIRDCTRAVTRHVGGRVWGVFREAEDLDEDGQIRDCCDTFASWHLAFHLTGSLSNCSVERLTHRFVRHDPKCLRRSRHFAPWHEIKKKRSRCSTVSEKRKRPRSESRPNQPDDLG